MKSHDQGEAEKQHAGGPVHLARELVGAEEKGLRHVRADHQHHGRRAEVMQAAQEVAERRVVGDEHERLVGLRGGGDVGESQRHAGDHLDDERHHRRAAEDVPPARVARHEMLRGRADEIDDAQPVVDPLPGSDQEPLHRVVVIGIGPALICTWPFATRTS